MIMSTRLILADDLELTSPLIAHKQSKRNFLLYFLIVPAIIIGLVFGLRSSALMVTHEEKLGRPPRPSNILMPGGKQHQRDDKYVQAASDVLPNFFEAFRTLLNGQEAYVPTVTKVKELMEKLQDETDEEKAEDLGTQMIQEEAKAKEDYWKKKKLAPWAISMKNELDPDVQGRGNTAPDASKPQIIYAAQRLEADIKDNDVVLSIINGKHPSSSDKVEHITIQRCTGQDFKTHSGTYHVRYQKNEGDKYGAIFPRSQHDWLPYEVTLDKAANSGTQCAEGVKY